LPIFWRNEMADHAASSVAEVAAGAATKATYATYTGAGATILGFFTSIDWVALTGLLVAVVGFLLNAYFQFKRNKREELESNLRIRREELESNLRIQREELEMKRLNGECNVKQD